MVSKMGARHVLGRTCCGTSGSVFKSKHLNDMFRQGLLYFAMTRDRLTNSRMRILIPIMSSTTPNQNASAFLQLTDEVTAFHES